MDNVLDITIKNDDVLDQQSETPQQQILCEDPIKENALEEEILKEENILEEEKVGDKTMSVEDHGEVEELIVPALKAVENSPIIQDQQLEGLDDKDE